MVTAAEWGQRVGLARPNFTPYLKRARAKKVGRADPPFRSYGDGRFYIAWDDAMAWMKKEKPDWIWLMKAKAGRMT